MSGRATGFTGGIPEHYDRYLGPVFFTDADDIAQRVVASAPARVLELAAGTGIVTRRLRDRLPVSTHLTATDLNPPMLAIAQTKFRPDEQVDLQQADATALPFPNGAFDAVVCQFGVMFFPDKDKSYREVNRVLAPTGHYVFSVWDRYDGRRYNRLGMIADNVTGNFFPVDPPQFYRIPAGYYKIDPIKDSLAEAGFTNFKFSVLSREKEVADIEFFARGHLD